MSSRRLTDPLEAGGAARESLRIGVVGLGYEVKPSPGFKSLEALAHSATAEFVRVAYARYDEQAYQRPIRHLEWIGDYLDRVVRRL